MTLVKFALFPGAKIFRLAALMAMAVAHTAKAGMLIEPNIIFADLSIPKSPIVADGLRLMIKSAQPECWEKGGGLIYLKGRPPSVSDKLIKQVILLRSQPAKRSLSAALLNYKDNDVAGFDGVIAYVNDPAPRFISFTAKTLKISSQVISNLALTKDLELAFCAVKPDIVRAP